MSSKRPLPVDRVVGQNIRIIRLQKSLSQTELGRRIGVSFQQIQKYENGSNRVGAGRLMRIAKVLGVPVNALFDGAPTRGRDPPHPLARSLLAKEHNLRLVESFDQITDRRLRTAVLRLVEILPKRGGK